MTQGDKEDINHWQELNASSRKSQYGYDTRQLAAQLHSSDPSKLYTLSAYTGYSRQYCIEDMRATSQSNLRFYGVTSYHVAVTFLTSR